jgi:Fe-S cluster biogenesis protein NfuA
MALDDWEVRVRVTRVEALLDEIEALGDADAKSTATEALQALLELYGEGLARLLTSAARLGGDELLKALAADELVARLLLVHGLHPIPVDARVLQALQEVRPYLAAHGGSVELLGVEDGVARLRLQGSCRGCPSSAMTLKLAIEQAIQKTAPDLGGIEAEGAGESASGTAFVPLSKLADDHG